MSRIGSLDCRSFEDRIQQILDDRLTLTGDDLLMAHAARCAQCEKILNDFDSVDDSVKLLPAELAQILLEADAKRVSQPFVSRRFILVASLAATIVILLNIIQALNNDQESKSSHVAQVRAVSQLAIASPETIIQLSKSVLPKPAVHYRPTPDSSPFSPEFSFVNSMPSIQFPTVPSWVEISQSLDPLEPVLTYSSTIPSIQPVHCSLKAGINLLKRSFSKSGRKPDLGFWIEPSMLAAV